VIHIHFYYRSRWNAFETESEILRHITLIARAGDEHFMEASEGTFYAFGDGYISVIDAETKRLLKTITTDENGDALVNQVGDPIQWADAVYMECPVSPGSEEIRSLILANQRDVYTDDALPSSDELFTNEPFSYVAVIDTDEMEIIGRTRVGPRPIHAYAVPWLNEFWTHPDGRAEFDVIHCDSIFEVDVERVKANVGSGGHGKLLVHPDLNNTAYATHTNEPYVFEIDLIKKELVRAHPIDGAELCAGLHAIEYSPINKHLYGECVGGGGIIEYDVNVDKVVHQWLEETGSLYESPDGGFIVSSNKVGSLFHVLQPQENGSKSTKEFNDIMIPNPGSPVFYPAGEVTGEDGESFEDFILFTPLINNPSSNYIQCEYAEDGRTLAVDESSGEALTPLCGSCNPDPQYNGANSGFAVFDLKDLQASDEVGDAIESVEPLLISAGGVEPTGPYPYSPECGYGRTYRKATRGGKWIVTGADFDFDGEPALAIVNAETRTLHGFVPLPTGPNWVTFVPEEKGLEFDSVYLSGGANDE